MILNIGPDKDGIIPPEFEQRALEIGEWLRIHGEAVFGSEGGNLTEFVTRGRQTIKGNCLYLIIRFWDRQPEMRLADLVAEVKNVTLLTTGQMLPFEQKGDLLLIKGLPAESPTRLLPVIKIECARKPATNQWGRERIWGGRPAEGSRLGGEKRPNGLRWEMSGELKKG